MRVFPDFKKQTEEVTSKASGVIRSRYGIWFLGLISFAESALLLPIITDPFMIAYILLHRTKSFLAVVVTTFTSVLGGFVAYITAAFFVDLITDYLSPATLQVFNEIIVKFDDEMFLLAFLGAVTPLPFTIAALAAGAINGNLFLFLLGSLLGRALRYGVVGYLVYKLGDQAMALVKRHILIISILSVVAAIIYILFKM